MKLIQNRLGLLDKKLKKKLKEVFLLSGTELRCALFKYGGWEKGEDGRRGQSRNEGRLEFGRMREEIRQGGKEILGEVVGERSYF